MDTTHVYLQKHAEHRAREYGRLGADSGSFKVLGMAAGEKAADILGQIGALIWEPKLEGAT
jgi:hypothetical protein